MLTGVLDAAWLGGWRLQHLRRTDLGLLQGHPGWPDVVAIRHGRLLAIECKSDTGRVTPDQRAWLAALASVTSVEVRVARPSDYDQLVRDLVGDRLLARAGKRL